MCCKEVFTVTAYLSCKTAGKVYRVLNRSTPERKYSFNNKVEKCV
jgi:hypothetical protein